MRGSCNEPLMFVIRCEKMSCLRKRAAYPRHMDSRNDMALLAAVANMLKARFSIRQIAAALGVSMAEAVELAGKVGQEQP